MNQFKNGIDDALSTTTDMYITMARAAYGSRKVLFTDLHGPPTSLCSVY